MTSQQSTCPAVAHVNPGRGAIDDDPWLVALDIDGTLADGDGLISDTVIAEVHRLVAAGHQVMLATGRSLPTTIPILDRLGITPRFLVCSNGAVTAECDPAVSSGYRHEQVSSFDPGYLLRSVRAQVSNARFAVEDERGHYRYTHPFPEATRWLGSQRVRFHELFRGPVTRLIVSSSEHGQADFLTMVQTMGLTRACWVVDWTAWLDIAADGVNKASAMERVRVALGIPRDRVIAVADGRNDIELLRWASHSGRGVAMGQSPAAVMAAAGERTGTVEQNGLGEVLASL
jgi:5-amino-6-(5-phospho-D-ribitylamino)uracil phosphatase